MKSFDDFLASISEDDLERIAADTAKQLSGEDNKIRLSDVANYSALISVAMLRKYHQWLSDQLI